jgi:uncharacterized FAD-dependent dehydrogenase
MPRYLHQQLKVPLADRDQPLPHLLRQLRLREAEVTGWSLVRLSLDNRRGHAPGWVCQVEFETTREIPVGGQLKRLDDALPPALLETPGERDFPEQVHVVGAGPAGLWAALTLLRRGYRVVLHERGKPVEQRFRDIRRFVKGRILDPDSNVLFGEGGAGAFSDGKLTSRTRNAFTLQVLEDLVHCGAGPEVRWMSKAHIGTDRLQFHLKAMRAWILELGGEIRFGSRLEELELSGAGSDAGGAAAGAGGAAGAGAVRNLRAIKTQAGWLPAEALVLATGHSARDVYAMLHARGVRLEPKPFAVGIRAEHPQQLINRRHFATGTDLSLTGPAEYVLRAPAERGSAYSFCMCPGGVLVPCATEPGELSTNGMSYSRRSAKFANSGIVVPVDLREQGLFAGLEFQRELERRAFEFGGGNWGAPAQSLRAFLDDRYDVNLPASSWPGTLKAVRHRELLGQRMWEDIAESLLDFDRKIPGFIREGLAVSPETRTSSPLRIPRDPLTLEAVGIGGLYPLGEGAGYAGGIVSSAADGVRLGCLAKLRRAGPIEGSVRAEVPEVRLRGDQEHAGEADHPTEKGSDARRKSDVRSGADVRSKSDVRSGSENRRTPEEYWE